MPAKTSKSANDSEPAVVIVGDHPAAHAAALRLAELKTPCVLADPGTTPLGDRLVTVGPELAALGGPFAELASAGTAVGRVRFLAAAGASAATTDALGKGIASKKKGIDPAAPPVRVASMADLRERLRAAAEAAGVRRIAGQIAVEEVDEAGVRLRVNRSSLAPKLLIVVDPLPRDAAVALGCPSAADGAAFAQSLSVAELDPGLVTADDGEMPMALDLGGVLAWGWLLRDAGRAQVCVLHPGAADAPGLVREWAALLEEHGAISAKPTIQGRQVKTRAVPLAGALRGEVVARRSIVCGPAGGFLTAAGEDVYPCCWSASLAAEVAAKAVKSAHVQDALGVYRGKWGGTLGEYLQGPQQNLRFLMPLIFKNPVMTDRMAEAILRGQSLVK